MFSSVGWGEVLVLIVVGIIVVGPERLPRLITDLKALLLAARNAIANARQELDQDFGEDFEEFRKPLSQLNSVRQMGARGFITKTLLDDDDSFLTDLESTAKDVTGAVRGTTAQISGSAPKNPPRPSEVPSTSDGATAGAEGHATGEERVELPQQDEVGQSRDWSSPGNLDDTL
ncbi:Sec-independent protein translocase protein TatB [Corynebacterium sp.]|uniref:Sec-independent protein translocase protein TatB n=1 Tax=Corynebacterium sp. TaxID=1720 RepID=UPI0025BB5577|nr:Sec-independent protein translocase protein TatB [Corynebacterium sp.]